jgi:hypothetical protein
MAEADKDHTIVATALDWVPLADVYRHAVSASLNRRPEAEIGSEILEAMRSGKLPNQVKQTIRYPPRPPGAPTSEPPPMEVTHNTPMPMEVLTIGIAGGRGSLHVDWQNSRATRRAGRVWDRIEFDGIWCSRARALALWSIELTPGPVAAATAAEAPEPAELERTRRSAGAKPKFDWDAIHAEATRRILDDGVPDNISAFSTSLIEWYQEQFKTDDRPTLVLCASMSVSGSTHGIAP